MGVVTFPARNKLAYPTGGVRAGVDPSHPASKNLILSALAGPGNNYIDLRTGAPLTNQQGTQTNVPSASINGIIGPAVTSLTGGKALGIAFDGARTVNALTCAGILRYSASTVAGYQAIITFDDLRGFWVHGDALDFIPGSVDNAGPTLSFNTPYFVAASAVPSGPLNLVAKNLQTGQILITTLTTGAGLPFSGKGTVDVGNDISNEFSNFPIAAAMAADTFLSLPQLLQWANDPWAFWYPNKATNRIATAAAGGAFLAAWARGSNLPVIGTGNY